jgi:gem associated protein 5
MFVEESWRTKPKDEATEAGFGTDGWLLASGSKDKTIRIWSTSKCRQLLMFKLPAPGKKERNDEGGRSRVWLNLCWLQHNPELIASSSLRYCW